MAERRLATPAGTLRLVGGEEHLDAALGLVLQTARLAHPPSGPIRLGGARAWLKSGRLRGRSRLRHALRGWLLASPAPRVREYQNLAWLRGHGFQAPAPLAAAVLSSRGLPAFQMLVTQEIERARTLRAFLGDERAAARRAPVLDELARETARMHALGFVHRDLYPRNLLVAPAGTAPRVFFLDAWAGGPGPGLVALVNTVRRRGPAYDLAALMLYGCELLDAAEQGRFFELYLSERAAHGRPTGRARLLARVAAERAALARRLARRPRELRGRPPPSPAWSPPPA